MDRACTEGFCGGAPRAGGGGAVQQPKQSGVPRAPGRPLHKVKPGADRVGLSAFVVALCIVAMQAFTHDPDGARPAKLLTWLQQGGGPSIVARRL